MADVRVPDGEALKRLRDVLVDHYSRARFEVELGHLDQNLEAISVDRDMPTIVGRVLLEARRGGWLPRLLAWAAREPYPAVAAVAEDLLAGTGPWARTCLDGDPFLGRPGLRVMLRAALAPGGAPVLAVTGPPGSGRSYTARFVEYATRALGGFRTALADLGTTLDDLPASAAKIRIASGLPDSPGVDIDRLVTSLSARRPLVLMLDGLDDAGPHSVPVLLAHRLRREPVAGLTLILLGHDPRLPDVPVEHLTPITAEQVLDHLAEVAEDAGLVLENGALAEFTAWVLHGRPPARAVGPRVRRLDAALRARAAS